MGTISNPPPKLAAQFFGFVLIHFASERMKGAVLVMTRRDEQGAKDRNRQAQSDHASDTEVGIGKISMRSILAPIKARRTPNPYLRYRNAPKSLIKKKSARSPRPQEFDVKTINNYSTPATPRDGIQSEQRSDAPRPRGSKCGVATRRPCSIVKKSLRAVGPSPA